MKRKDNQSFHSYSSPRQKRRKQPAVTTVKPQDLISKANNVKEEPYSAPFTFNELNIHGTLKKNLAARKFVKPTQIQAETVDHLLNGKDIVGIANTGTGKTGAFLVPIIHRLLTERKEFQSLIILPTRELALQVESEFRSLAKGTNFKSVCLIGGTSVGKDIQNLQRKNHIIIGTPGRLIDLSQRRALDLAACSVLVLDEFDRLLDMGFLKDVQQLIHSMKNREQTMLFSATEDLKQDEIIRKIVQKPIKVNVVRQKTQASLIEQDIIEIPTNRDKFDVLKELISGDAFNKVLIFTETKRLSEKISKRLTSSGFSSDTIHGNKTQNYRIKALDKFRSGRIQVLVATDVAARGIDITDITHVINYQIPRTMDSYIHRVGRTGRAGKIGHAFTFID